MFRISHLTKFAAGVLLASAFAPNTAFAGCQPEPYIGQVCWTASYYCPRNYAQAQGQLLDINSNQALFSLLGTNYGGDGRTSFALPDLRGRSAIGTGQMNPAVAEVVLGEKRGFDILEISAKNLPPHTHTINGGTINLTGTLKVNKTTGDKTSPVNNYMGVSSNKSPNYSLDTPTVTMAANVSGKMTMPSDATTSVTGTDYHFIHRPPVLGLNACIALKGVYPPRS